MNFSYGATEKELGKRKWKRGVSGVQLSTSSQPRQPLAQEETLQTLIFGVSGRKRVMRKTMETLEVEGGKRRKTAVLIKEGEKATIPVTGSTGLPSVGRRGLNGGLLLLWKEGWGVSVNSFSIAHIDVFATIPSGFSFRFTEFYGHPKPSQRHHSLWELLRRLSHGNLRP
ncbi:unnamed protein product [Prunus brigantina]